MCKYIISIYKTWQYNHNKTKQNKTITVMSKWAWWHLKSPASRLFTQPFIRAQIKENIKAPRHWPLCREFTSDRWIPAEMASNTENVSIWWHHYDHMHILWYLYSTLLVWIQCISYVSKKTIQEEHWKPRVIMGPNLSLLVVPQVVIIKIFHATIDNKVCIMTRLGFHFSVKGWIIAICTIVPFTSILVCIIHQNNNSRSHLTNDISITILIQWKFGFALNQILIKWSLQNFAHGNAWQLCCHGMCKKVAIWWLRTELQQNEIFIEFELRVKNLCWNGSQVPMILTPLRNEQNRQICSPKAESHKLIIHIDRDHNWQQQVQMQ